MYKDKAKHKAYMREYRRTHKACIYRERVKREVLTHYGDGKCACIRCGYDDLRALSIDHMNGGGNKHRRKLFGSMCGQMIYYWLRRSNYPIGYQTLCMNCQFIKRHEKQEFPIPGALPN